MSAPTKARFPGAAQHGAISAVTRVCDALWRNDALQTRDRYELGVCGDPGSAVHHFAPLRAAPHPGNKSTAEKRRQYLEHRVRLLQLRQMAGARDHFDPRAGDFLRELLRIDRRDDAIALAPDDQGRRGDAVAALG